MTSNILESLKNIEGCIFFALDKEYRYTYFSTEHFNIMKKIWGKEISIGGSVFKYIKSDEDKLKAKCNVDRALKGETVTIDERYGDDSFFRTTWRDTYTPIYNDNGEIVSALVYVKELTEEIQMQNRFNELKVFENIINLIDAGITLVDHKSENKSIIFANDKFCKMTGYSKNELFEKSIRVLEGPDTSKKNLEKLREAVKNKKPCSLEFINYRKDRSKFINFINISPIFDKEGDIVYYVAIHIDITSKIELGKLETLKNIASGLTHEINTALVSMGGNLDMLRYDIEDLKDESLQKSMFSCVDTVKGSSDKISKIVNTLHYFNTSSLDRKAKNLNIYDILKDSIEFFKVRIKSHNINIKIDGINYKESANFLNVFVEKGSMLHLFEIVIENAIDALSEIEKEKNIEISISKTDKLKISIKDNGNGIDENIIDDIFKPLIKGKAYRGLGLNLYIGKIIVDLYSGNISFNTSKSGTEFIILLDI